MQNLLLERGRDRERVGDIGHRYSNQTLHLGTYEATPEQVARFEGQATTVEIVE